MKAFANLRIGTRLWLLLLGGALGMAAVVLWLVLANYDGAMEEKRLATRHIVEVAHSTLAQLDGAVRAGSITREEAQKRAIAAVKAMRYEGEEYLWINDTKPVMVMHPMKPELDGKDLSGIKDPNGKALFVAFVDAVKAKGAGFVDYLWPKPGASAPVPKISYVKAFEPWGWIIGSGIYVDDVEAAFWRGLRTTSVILLAAALVYVVLVYLLIRSITRPLRSAVAAAEAVSSGDLTQRFEATSRDETGQLLAALGRMNGKLHEVIGAIRNSTDEVNTASREIAAGNSDLSQRTEEQASSLEETASSMEELTSTVQQNADNAKQANQLAVSASAVASRGGAVVGEVVTTMNAISSSSKKIADIISVIDGIAFQTNILALNAAVEAARAGEQGRGFAVVASEVRSLAQRSAAAAKEIKGLITDSVAKVDSGSKLVADAGKTMDEVVSSVKRVTDIMAEITAASLEQSSGIEQVNQAIVQMDQVTQQNAALVEQSAAAAESMEEQARQLASAVAVFKLAHGEGAAPASAVTADAPAATRVGASPSRPVRPPRTFAKALPRLGRKASAMAEGDREPVGS